MSFDTLQSEKIKPAILCDDGWHCSPKCPYIPRSDDTCCLSGDELDWHDYFIASCELKTEKDKSR